MQQYAHCVVCPTCSEPARLTVLYNDHGGADSMMFCCRNQSDGAHQPLSAAAMWDLLPKDVDLARLDRLHATPG
jgi:hypothetical protein